MAAKDAAKTHCRQGHLYDEANTYRAPDGDRKCRTCRRNALRTKSEALPPVLDDRFWSKVDKTGDCWVWTAAVNEKGYGRYSHEGRTWRAHRFVFEGLHGPTPDGQVIDHLCRNRRCVNPDHLEAVTPRINTLRGDTSPARNAAKTHCNAGHEFNEKNTRITSKGHRDCRACGRKYRSRRRWYETT